MSLTLTLERGGGEVSGSGTNIELDGTIAGGAIESVEMYGDTEQQTYSGKNLFNLAGASQFGVEGKINSDGSYTISGTANRTDGAKVFAYVGSLPAGTYTFTISQALPKVINFSIASGIAARIAAGDTSATVTTTQAYSGASVYFAVDNGASYNITLKMQLVSGSTADYDFEPYVGGTASPNPDYPQEVQTVTGRQLVTISDGGNDSQEYEVNLGKNLFDKDNVNEYMGYFDGAANSPTLVSGLTTRNRVVYIPCVPNTTYSISLTDRSNINDPQVGTTDSLPADGLAVSKLGNFASGSLKLENLTTSSSAKYIVIRFQTPSGITYDSIADTLLSGLQIEKGSTATTYAPYFTPIELCKIGDYQDYIYKSGEDWYIHKEIATKTYTGASGEGWSYFQYSGYSLWRSYDIPTGMDTSAITSDLFKSNNFTYWVNDGASVSVGVTDGHFGFPAAANNINFKYIAVEPTLSDWTTWLANHPTTVYYPLATPTDTQITNSALIAQLNALNSAQTYEGETVITVGSENLAGSLEITAATNIAKTYTEVEIGSPFTITDVEGKSSNTTLDGNVYVDWAYNKKQYSFDLFNLTPQDYADIRAFYDYQFNNSAFPTITVPELNIDKLPVYMEISSRNIINQCLLTDKLTIKFRETVQP